MMQSSDRSMNTRQALILTILCVAASAAILLGEQETVGGTARKVTKEVVSENASDLYPASLAFSADGQHLAYMVRAITPAAGGVESKSMVRVVVDGAAGKEYDQVQSAHDDPSEGEIRFSPDGKHFAYAARLGQQWHVVLDGREHAAWDRIMGPAFSPDGRSLLYGAEKGDKHYLVLDEKVVGPFDWSPIFSFSGDGRKLAYYASQKGKECYMVDGREQCHKDQIIIGSFVWSPAGDHYAYQISDGAGEQHVVLDGVTQKARPEVQDFKFSPNGKRYAYGYRSPEGWRAVIDGKESEPSLMVPTIRFSVDGTHVAYTASRSTEAFVMFDGKEGAPYQGINRLAFSSDGKHLVYAALKPDQTEVVVMDGKEICARAPITQRRTAFMPQSPTMGVYFWPLFCGEVESPVLWHLNMMDSYVVVDEKAGSTYQSIGPLQNDTPSKDRGDDSDDILNVFSPDCRHIAYTAQKKPGVMTMVLDGQEGKEYPSIGWARFSPDGKTLVYVGSTRKEAYLVLNGSESEPYERILSPIFFTGPSTFHYFARQNGKIYRIIESVSGPLR